MVNFRVLFLKIPHIFETLQNLDRIHKQNV